MWIAVGLGLALSFVVMLVRAGAREKQEADERDELLRVPLSKIGELAPADQPVRITGKVCAIDDATVEGPHSGARGLLAVAETWMAGVARSGRGVRIQEGRLDRTERQLPILLADDSGQIRVAVDHVELQLEMKQVSADAKAAAGGFGSRMIDANRRAGTEYLEGVVKEGDTITVVGYVRRDGDALLVSGDEATPLIINNHHFVNHRPWHMQRT